MSPVEGNLERCRTKKKGKKSKVGSAQTEIKSGEKRPVPPFHSPGLRKFNEKWVGSPNKRSEKRGVKKRRPVKPPLSLILADSGPHQGKTCKKKMFGKKKGTKDGEKKYAQTSPWPKSIAFIPGHHQDKKGPTGSQKGKKKRGEKPGENGRKKKKVSEVSSTYFWRPPAKKQNTSERAGGFKSRGHEGKKKSQTRIHCNSEHIFRSTKMANATQRG